MQFDHTTVGGDVLTQELAGARPRLREDLQVSLLTFDEHPWYLVEDPQAGKFYRIGEVEYVFLSHLDGRTLAEVIAVTASRCGESAFTEDEAASLCHWLISADLIETTATSAFERLAKENRQRMQVARRSWLNPVMLKVPLFDPHAIVQKLTDLSGWLISLPMLAVWFLCCGFAALTLLAEWPKFSSAASQVVDRNNWMWMALTWLLLKMIHEAAHAVTCGRFGGRVRECGVLFLLLIPMPYVDVSSSWRFPEKWQRILTAAAGMLAEFFLAAIAIFVWSTTSSPIVQQHCVNVIVSATMVTLLFNANPLMRFDGYYILTDWLELPNLSTRARATMRGWQRWLFFGLGTKAPLDTDRHRWLVNVYAVTSTFWMVTVILSISIGAANLLPGVGLLLAAISVGMWLVPSTSQLIRFLLFGTEHEQPRRLWFVAVAMGLSLTAWGIGEWFPAPSRVVGPVVVEHVDLQVIRNQTSGTIQHVAVRQGDSVQVGDLLIELQDDELEAEYRILRTSIKQTELKLRSHIQHQEMAAAQIESETLTALFKRRTELESMRAALTIYAALPGTVMSPNLEELAGMYFTPGTKLMEIAELNSVRAVALVSPVGVSLLRNKSFGQLTELKFWGSPSSSVEGVIESTTPQATTRLPHPSFGADLGGPFAVRPVLNPSEQSASKESAWELLSPKIEVEISLPRTNELKAGQTGMASLRADRGNLRTYLVNQTTEWWNNRFLSHHGI